jgi:hypothetical protein
MRGGNVRNNHPRETRSRYVLVKSTNKGRLRARGHAKEGMHGHGEMVSQTLRTYEAMITRETCNIAISSTMLLNTTSIGQMSSINKETMSARPSLKIVLMLEVARRGGRLAEARGVGSYRCPLPYPPLPPNTYGHHCRKQKSCL